jgi:hypothetical protein
MIARTRGSPPGRKGRASTRRESAPSRTARRVTFKFGSVIRGGDPGDRTPFTPRKDSSAVVVTAPSPSWLAAASSSLDCEPCSTSCTAITRRAGGLAGSDEPQGRVRDRWLLRTHASPRRAFPSSTGAPRAAQYGWYSVSRSSAIRSSDSSPARGPRSSATLCPSARIHAGRADCA